MVQVVQTEIRKRGFFGWLFLVLFIVFNIFMGWWLIDFLSRALPRIGPIKDATPSGIITTAMGAGLVLFIWLTGAVVLGLFAMLTRGRKTIITHRKEGPPA